MTSRLRPLTVVATLVVAVALVAAAALVKPRAPVAHNSLYQNGVAVDAEGNPTIIAAGEQPQYLAGTRILDPGPGDQLEAAEILASESHQWLAEGQIPGAGHDYAELATTALLDLRTLTSDDGAVLAGPSTNWRYVWPRDASFVVAAYTATGHPADAISILEFLQQVQEDDGSFHARYLPDGSGVPDERGLQTDGTAWVLWALDRLLAAAPELGLDVAALRDQFTPMIERSTDYLLSQTNTESGLPLPSADYWERQESQVTLGTAAPVLAGLEASERIYRGAGLAQQADDVVTRTEQLRGAITDDFGQYGYGRYPSRTAQDAATAFTLPPFLAEPLPGALVAWQTSIGAMQRPAGGLAPGSSWREPSMSWTPETALYAWAAASNGQDALAWQWIEWIDEHRTATGSIPEKVGPDGSPAHVAPLTWSCALVLLTLAELDEPR
ncbi:glycoside hydrolase family 15 [Ruania zhangjianzhongii]|uniref:glycoside hydrolase family 15 n=1 Tax=Ruania zhangjianzhongii TaxID=2603206 RepID=UPI0011CAF685|nr:glycoside hydrolase family 15 [Ruania zhangjianzhongii]